MHLILLGYAMLLAVFVFCVVLWGSVLAPPVVCRRRASVVLCGGIAAGWFSVVNNDAIFDGDGIFFVWLGIGAFVVIYVIYWGYQEMMYCEKNHGVIVCSGCGYPVIDLGDQCPECGRSCAIQIIDSQEWFRFSKKVYGVSLDRRQAIHYFVGIAISVAVLSIGVLALQSYVISKYSNVYLLASTYLLTWPVVVYGMCRFARGIAENADWRRVLEIRE